MDVFSSIKKIKKEFSDFERELHNKFRLVVRDTEKGIWGTSNIDVVFQVFKSMGLEKYKTFLDIGCGDGRVTLVASLFTSAMGIEFDRDLILKGREIQKKLQLSHAELVQGDFFHHDFSQYDILFVNPDTGFYNGLEDKLLNEMKGLLLVYNDVFLPRFLKRGKTHWVNQVPVTEFTRS